MNTTSPLLKAAIVGVLVSRAAALAGSIHVANQGFEDSGLAAGSQTSMINGWNDIAGSPTRRFVSHVAGFSDDGYNHLAVEQGWTVFQDVPGARFEPNTIYALRVAAGNRAGQTVAGNVSGIDLANPDGLTAAVLDFNAFTGTIPDTFGQMLLRYTTGTVGSLIGTPARIVLGSYGTGRSHFDNVRLTSVGTFTGGDPGEGLDLQGDFAYAVNVGTNGAPGLIGNANFTADSAAGVSITPATNVIDNWSNPNYGATTNDDRLELAMRSIRWSPDPYSMTVTLANLQPGRAHKLQLLFVEQCCDRIFDVVVDGVMVFDNFRPQDFDNSGTGAVAGKPLVITHTFVPSSTSVTIDLAGYLTPASVPDKTPTLSAFTLERLGGTAYDFAAPLSPETAFTYGSAGVTGGEMVLTPASASQTGALVVPNLTGTQPVGSFDVTFDAFAGSGSVPPGEGYCFCWGNVPAAAFGEEGPAGFSGLVVSFDYSISAGETQKEVTVKWGGVQAGAAVFDAGTNAYAPVHIRLRPGGLLDVRHGTTQLFTGLAVPGLGSQTAPRWGFGAGTGGSFALQKLDNLRISPFPLTVTSGADSGPGSLRDALALASSSAFPGPDQVHFAAALNGGTITLGGTELNPGAQTVTVDASMLSGGVTISGNNASRVCVIPAAANVLMNRLTIAGGNVGAGQAGGGIFSAGTLTMMDSSLSRNNAGSTAGGLVNSGTLVMERCSVTENAAGGAAGMQNLGTATLTGCTICGNVAGGGGGGIGASDGVLTLAHCTVAANSGGSGGVGGLIVQAPVILKNAIIAGNTSPANPAASDLYLFSGTLAASGVNLIGITNDSVTAQFPAGLPNAGGNHVGTASAPLDAMLMPPGNYGGFTQTMHPKAGSPVIDPVNGSLTAPIGTDQRGLTRVADGDGNGTARLDIGAVEAGAPVTVTNTNNDGPGSLRAAVAAVTVPGQRILFSAGLSGGTINLLSHIVVDRTVFIDASRLPAGLRLDGGGTQRLFLVTANQAIGGQALNITTATGTTATQSSGYNGDQFPASLALDGNPGNFTHTAAGDPGPTWTADFHRDVRLNTVVLRNRGDGCCPERLSDITVRLLDANDLVTGTPQFLNFNNELGGPATLTFRANSPVLARKIQVTRDGGSIVGAPGVLSLGEVEAFLTATPSVVLQGLTFTGGGGGNGGAIFNYGWLTVNHSTFTGNSVTAYAPYFDGGGAIYNVGLLSVNHATFSGNDAGFGAGIYNGGVLKVNRSTFSGNSSSRSGAISNDGVVSLNDSIVAGNSPDNFSGSWFTGSGNLTSGDPKLAPLGNYGGPTLTMPPRPGSPALDRVAPTGSLLVMTDQRGFPRVMWGKADIGAVEAGVMADCAWEVRDIYRSPATALNSMADAEDRVADPAATAVVSTHLFINFADPQTNVAGGGFFPGDVPFASNNLTPQGLLNGDDNDFVTIARTFIQITAEDDYTFGFSSDDGARLRIFGATFTSSTRLNATNPANPAHSGDTLSFPGLTGNSDTLGVCHLTPGIYPIEFLTWERDGGAYAEVFSARGAKTAVDASFRLIGDPVPAQDFSMGTLAAPGWNVAVIRNGANSLNAALTQVFAHWSSAAQPNTTLATVASLNYYDPQSGGGGHGQTQTPFPGNLAGDDNSFALGARATLTVPAHGYYTFCILGDDSVRFRIKGSRGWTVSGGALPFALVDGFQTNGCCTDVFGQVRLAAGTYEVELVYNEIGGGAYAGVWGARGQHSAFTPAAFTQLGAPGVVAPPFAIARQTGLPVRPLNDNFAAAFVLSGAVATAASCNEGATLQSGEPDPFPGGTTLRKSVWWEWTAPASGLVQVDTIGSDFHTILAIHTGPAVNALTQVAADVHSAGNNTSRLTFTATANTVYRIQVGGDPLGDAGILRLKVGPPPAVPVVPAPANDNFAAATALNGTTATASGNTSFATAEAGEPAHYDAATGSVWFTWTAPSTGDYIIDTIGSRFDTVLVVYTGTSLGALTVRAAADQGGDYDTSRLILSATGGVTYRITIDGWFSGARGAYFLNISPYSAAILGSTLTPATPPGTPTNTMTLRWQSEPWTTYRVEQSTDLTSWTPVTNCTASEGAQTEIDITGVPATTTRLFFRVLRQ